MRHINTVSIIGLGAIGCFFAKGIQSAIGDNLRIIADGERASEIKEKGRVINGKQYYFNVCSPNSQSSFSDLVIVITKYNQLKEAALSIKNQVGPDTILMCPLNGVESEDILSNYYPDNKILYSITRVASTKRGNDITYSEKLAYIEFGDRTNDENSLSDEVLAVSELFKSSSIDYRIPKDMLLSMWNKFMCNCSENQSSAVLGIPFGAWHNNVHANFIREAIMKEVISVANAQGIPLSTDMLPAQQELLRNVAATARTSTLQDIENKRKTEVEMFSGAIIRMGKKYNVPTPINEIFYHAIKTLEDKNEGAFDF
jgi:2-dehydropantoate 2-reductase